MNNTHVSKGPTTGSAPLPRGGAPPRYTKCACGRTLTDHRSHSLHSKCSKKSPCRKIFTVFRTKGSSPPYLQTQSLGRVTHTTAARYSAAIAPLSRRPARSKGAPPSTPHPRPRV